MEPVETVDTFEEVAPLTEVAGVTEHEDEMQMYQEETVTKTQFYDMEAILHKQTGEILTFVEAIRQGLLDLASGQGEFIDLASGAKISLEKAIELGYIDASFRDVLDTRYGVRHPATRQELTLLEAIQAGIYDPDCRQLRDPSTGDVLSMPDAVSQGIISFADQHKLLKMGILKLPPMTLETAIEQQVINVETGNFQGRYTKEVMPLREALRNGYVSMGPIQMPQLALTLTDAIEQRFVDAHSGELAQRGNDEKLSLRDAVSKKNCLLNLNIKEIVNTNDHTRMTLGDAVVRNAINTRQGNYTDLQKRQSLSFAEARDRGLIEKPLTLFELARRDQLDSGGRLFDAGTKRRMPLLEACATGLIDPDARHIVDPEEGDIVSITMALERGILDVNGHYIHPESNRHYNVQEAVREGLITERIRSTIYDIRGIKNTQTGLNVNFKQAVEEGIVVPSSERIVNLETGESCALPDAFEKGLMEGALHEALSAPSGIKDNHGNELSVFRATCQGLNAFVTKRM